LTHTSGFRAAPNDVGYSQLKAMVAGGVNLVDKTFAYMNQNFALFRVVIPYLNGFNESGVTDKDTATSAAYLAYLNQQLFAPSGIATIPAAPASSEPTLCYPMPAGSVSGTHFGDWTKLSGGAGLHLSSDELATFLVKLRHSSLLLTPAQTATMTEQLLGWQGRNPVRHGHVNDHGGYLWAPTASNGKIEVNTLAVSFSAGVQASVLVNSRINSANLYQAAIDAYHGAWVSLAP
jgi:hypothetical protein